MTSKEDVLHVLHAQREDLFSRIKHKKVFKNDQEVYNILDQLEKHISVGGCQEEYQDIAVKYGIYNWISSRGRELKDELDVLQGFWLEREHDLCHYAKSFWLQADKMLVMQAYENARGTVLKCGPNNTAEQLWKLLLTHTRRQALLASFTSFWENYRSWLYNQAFEKIRHREAAEDLLQVTYEKGLRYIVHIQDDQTFPEYERLKAWSRTIMLHAFLDMKKEMSHYPSDSLEANPEQIERLEAKLVEEAERLEDTVFNQETQEEIATLLRQLTPSDRELLILHWFKGQTAMEIARNLNKPRETIQAQLKRVRPKILAKFSAKELRAYLNKSPRSEIRVNQLLTTYIPRGDDPEWAHEVLALHVAGNNVHEIAALVGNQDASMASQIAEIQNCLDENLSRLFSTFYKKGK